MGKPPLDGGDLSSTKVLMDLPLHRERVGAHLHPKHVVKVGEVIPE